jgi:hypothetical protein
MSNGKRRKASIRSFLSDCTGASSDTFHKMASILQKEFAALRARGGDSSKPVPEDKPYISLEYLREYRTMDGVHEGAVRLALYLSHSYE